MKTPFSFAMMATLLMACGEIRDPATPGSLVPKTVDQDSSLPAIHVNGTLLHAETYGDPTDPMVVTLHGGPGGDYASILNCRDLANDGYFVVFFDQRGSGLSPRYGYNDYTMQLLIDDLSGVIQTYRSSPTQKVFLFGISWGAMLATAYVNENPDAVDGMILAEPGGFTYEDMKSYVNKLNEVKLDENTNDAIYADQFVSGSEDKQELLDYRFALAAAHNSAPGNVEGIAGPTPFFRYGYVVQVGLFNEAKREGFDVTANLHKYTTEILFLYSELNTAYGKDYANHLAAAYPNASVMQVTGTGHKMVYFGWQSLRPLMLDYLNSHK